MRHPWLSVRMGLVGCILLAFYVPAIWVASAFGVPLEAAIVGSVICLYAQYWAGNRRALTSVNATQLDDDHPFVQRTHEIAEELDVPPPKVSIGQFGSPNAFAIGRRGKGHIVVSSLLLSAFEKREIEAVLAHEASHLRSRDTIPMVIGQGSAGIAFLFASVIESVLIPSGARGERRVNTPLSDAAHGIVMCFVFAISRHREYVADADAARALGSPRPMQSALRRLARIHSKTDLAEPPEAVESLCIASDWSFATLFSSHPSLEDRVESLGN